MKSIFEKMGDAYRREGDYLLPNLSLPPDAEEYQIGKYGRLRKQYLKEHRRALYTCMMADGTLWKHLSGAPRGTRSLVGGIPTE